MDKDINLSSQVDHKCDVWSENWLQGFVQDLHHHGS